MNSRGGFNSLIIPFVLVMALLLAGVGIYVYINYFGGAAQPAPAAPETPHLPPPEPLIASSTATDTPATTPPPVAPPAYDPNRPFYKEGVATTTPSATGSTTTASATSSTSFSFSSFLGSILAVFLNVLR